VLVIVVGDMGRGWRVPFPPCADLDGKVCHLASALGFGRLLEAGAKLLQKASGVSTSCLAYTLLGCFYFPNLNQIRINLFLFGSVVIDE
jgi:hypothetical protein